MDASIKGENIKTFLRLLQCASKYGDDLNIHASSKSWEMAVTNSSKSAFCLFRLQKKFFYRWSARSRRGIKCKLLVKSVLAVLGKAAQINNILRIDLRIVDPSNELRPLQHRKNGDRDTRSSSAKPDSNGNGNDDDNRHFGDEDEFTDDEDARISIESKLIVRLVCNHGVTKKHSLHLGSSDFLRADVDPDTTPNGFVIATRTLRDWLENFAISSGSAFPGNANSGGTDQLGWMFTKNEVRMKSWEGMGNGGGLCTEIKVDTDEFQEYEVAGDRIDLTLPMKEFRATLMLGEQLSATLNISFSEAGQPLTLTSLDDDSDEYSIFCAIATTACEAFNDVRSPSIEIKRSSSDNPPQQPPSNRPSSRPPSSSNNARNDTQTSSSGNTGNNRKRKGSETPSQSRKRSSLNFAAAEEPMSNVYLAPSLQRGMNNAGPSGTNGSNRRQDQQMNSGHPDHNSHSQNGNSGQGSEEALFLPGASQRPYSSEQGENHQYSSPQKSQAIKMSQAEVLEYAGLGDMDFDEALDGADLEDEREMEEEFTRSQAVQDTQLLPIQQQDQPHNEEGEAERGRTPVSRQVSRGRLEANAGGSRIASRGKSIGRNSSSPEKGKGKERALPLTKGSNETSTSGDKSNKSHPERVTDSISNNTTTNNSNTNESGLVWDTTIDTPGPSTRTTSPAKRQLSPTKNQDRSLNRGYASSPQKRQSSPTKLPEKRQSVSSPSKIRNERSPSKSGTKQINQDEEEFDELTDDEDVGQPTQNRQGSTSFKAFMDY